MDLWWCRSRQLLLTESWRRLIWNFMEALIMTLLLEASGASLVSPLERISVLMACLLSTLLWTWMTKFRILPSSLLSWWIRPVATRRHHTGSTLRVQEMTSIATFQTLPRSSICTQCANFTRLTRLRTSAWCKIISVSMTGRKLRCSTRTSTKWLSISWCRMRLTISLRSHLSWTKTWTTLSDGLKSSCQSMWLHVSQPALFKAIRSNARTSLWSLALTRLNPMKFALDTTLVTSTLSRASWTLLGMETFTNKSSWIRLRCQLNSSIHSLMLTLTAHLDKYWPRLTMRSQFSTVVLIRLIAREPSSVLYSGAVLESHQTPSRPGAKPTCQRLTLWLAGAMRLGYHSVQWPTLSSIRSRLHPRKLTGSTSRQRLQRSSQARTTMRMASAHSITGKSSSFLSTLKIARASPWLTTRTRGDLTLISTCSSLHAEQISRTRCLEAPMLT